MYLCHSSSIFFGTQVKVLDLISVVSTTKIAFFGIMLVCFPMATLEMYANQVKNSDGWAQNVMITLVTSFATVRVLSENIVFLY